jgi:two-component system, cell cycle sensor histidine kinase and response regulator CckA
MLSAQTVNSPVPLGAALRWPEGVQPLAAQAGGTILLVDNDQTWLQTVHALVELLGFKVLIATDGFKAVEVFRRHRGAIRCVITDLMMPHMNGWDTLSALRKLEPGLPVILASSLDLTEALPHQQPDHPQAFLQKPFRLPQLRGALGRALAGAGMGISLAEEISNE